MTNTDKKFNDELKFLVDNIIALRIKGERLVIAIAGAPASGKSTLADALTKKLNQFDPQSTSLLPMDGFHLDNVILEEQNLLDRKGAPQTFDVWSFETTLSKIKNCEAPIYYPTFDRSKDIAIAGSGVILQSTEIVVVEGNYLLTKQGLWTDLSMYFDYTVFIDVQIETLKERLIKRWLEHGYDQEGAELRANSNDIPNAVFVMQNSKKADHTINL